jgi:GST-like protein
MTDATEYTPPKIWTWNKESGGRFAGINRPIAGATQEKELPVASILCSSTRWRPRTG